VASVVFMRAVNVGGHGTFRPAVLARELGELDVTSVGAAGTFVVRRRVRRADLRAELVRRIGFPVAIAICTGRELERLIDDAPFPAPPEASGARRYLSVLVRRPRTMPDLPLQRPAGGDWQVRLVGIDGKFVSSVRRPMGKRPIYPNEVVEREFGAPATTRNWDTILKLGRLLRGA
jgi:uncharacterized protein (DUF1697 family)